MVDFDHYLPTNLDQNQRFWKKHKPSKSYFQPNVKGLCTTQTYPFFWVKANDLQRKHLAFSTHSLVKHIFWPFFFLYQSAREHRIFSVSNFVWPKNLLTNVSRSFSPTGLEHISIPLQRPCIFWRWTKKTRKYPNKQCREEIWSLVQLVFPWSTKLKIWQPVPKQKMTIYVNILSIWTKNSWFQCAVPPKK